MRFMHWSWTDYLTAPLELVNGIIETMNELSERE